MKQIASIFILGVVSASFAVAAEPTPAPETNSGNGVATPIQRANDDAVARLYAQIAAESVGDVPVAQLIEKTDGYKLMMDGLARAEQIGGPRVVGEDFVQVQLQISGSRAAHLVLQAVTVKPEKSPISAERLAVLLQDWNQRVFSTTGASVERLNPEMVPMGVQAMDAGTTAPTSMATNTKAPTPIDLKSDTPNSWVKEALSTSGTAEKQASSLRTARAAEQAARDALRTRIHALKVGDQSTVGELCSSDEAIAKVINDAVESAKIFGIDYRGDGSVEVRISIDGGQLWSAMLATR